MRKRSKVRRWAGRRLVVVALSKLIAITLVVASGPRSVTAADLAVARSDGTATASACQVVFLGPRGMKVYWNPGPKWTAFPEKPLICPGRGDFRQGIIYSLKLTDVPGYEEVEFYPSLELAPSTDQTKAYLARHPIPILLTAEDFRQIEKYQFLAKVVYLPNANGGKHTLAQTKTIATWELDLGEDAIIEADRKGLILAIFRYYSLQRGQAEPYRGSPLPNGIPLGLPVPPVSPIPRSDVMLP